MNSGVVGGIVGARGKLMERQINGEKRPSPFSARLVPFPPVRQAMNQPRSQGLFSLPPTTMEAQKRDRGNEVGYE